MCFAPYISLSTFIIEFLLAFYFLLKNPKDNLNRIIALISFLLGFYQLNEFLICITGSTVFTKLAMVTTAVLPALAISFALILKRQRIRFWNILIFAPAVFFILMFTLTGYYDTPAVCNTVFIEYPSAGLVGDFFGLYYLVYIIGTAVLLYFASSKQRPKRVVFHLGMLGMFVFTVPTLVFLLFLPSLTLQFPSILCEFALLLAIDFIIILWYKDKHKLKF